MIKEKYFGKNLIKAIKMIYDKVEKGYENLVLIILVAKYKSNNGVTYKFSF